MCNGKRVMWSAAVAAGLVLAMGEAAQAAVINVPGDTADAVIYGVAGGDSSTATLWHADRSDTLAVGYNGKHYYDMVCVFKLPSLSPGAYIQSANITFYVDHVSYPTNNVWADLYGLAYRSAPDVLTSDWYGGGTNDPDATKIQAGIVTSNTLDGTAVSADPTGQTNLAAYLQNQYDAGAQAGDYIFLRLNTDKTDTKGYYQVYPADALVPSHRPSLTITTSAVPEPATLGLLALGGLMLAGRRKRRGSGTR